jgi:signal transduction histidine kinase
VNRNLFRDLIRMLWTLPLVALPFALFFGTLTGTGWHNYVIAYEASLVFAFSIRLCLIGYEWLALPALRARIRTGQASPWIEPVGYALMGVLGSYIASTILHFTFLHGILGNPRAFLVTGLFALLFTTLITGFFMARRFYRQAIDRARAVEQVRAELAQSELRALRAQINPHFLFNTLNTIAALIAENPKAAEDTTTRLAEVFRYALRASDHEHTRLADELDFLRSYLEIERTRFGDRLRVVESIAPHLESVLVPSLLFQPIVENAVRYGIGPRPEGGVVTLTVRREDDRLQVEIADDGPGIPADAPASGTGFGLHLVRERLRAAGPPHALAIDTQDGVGTRVRITLPMTRTSPELNASRKELHHATRLHDCDADPAGDSDRG